MRIIATDVISGNEVHTDNAAMTAYPNYKTWIPSPVTNIATRASGRNLSMSWDTQDIYGELVYRIQISKNNSAWYKPANNLDIYASVNNWYTGAVNGYLDDYASNTYSQGVPLDGQNDTISNARDTLYYYRIFAKNLTTNLISTSVSTSIVATATSAKDIVQSAIDNARIANSAIDNIKIQDGTIIASDKIAANSISTANLNVLAKNIVNNFVDGTKEGWSTQGQVVFDTEINMNVLEVSYPAYQFISNVFEILPTDIYEFKFGLQCPNYISDSGIYVGVTAGQTVKQYRYSNDLKKWELVTSASNLYFVLNYRELTKSYFKTYILGNKVDISNVPFPEISNTSYSIFCLQLISTETTCSIRSGMNASPTGTKFRFICPQVYRIGDGKIVAQNIVTQDLSAITANLGLITDGALQGNANNLWNLDTGVFKIGDGVNNYVSFDPAFGLSIKTTKFEVSSIGSVIRGEFIVKNDIGTQNEFEVDPVNNFVQFGQQNTVSPRIIIEGLSGGATPPTFTSPHHHLEFSNKNDTSQNVAFIFSMSDSYRSGDGIILLGANPSKPNGGAWFETEGDLFVGRNVNISGTAISSSATTGALTVVGGIGTQGDINIGGSMNLYGGGIRCDGILMVQLDAQVRGTLNANALTINTSLTGFNATFTDPTESNSISTGAVTIAGGLGVAKRLTTSALRVMNGGTIGLGLNIGGQLVVGDVLSVVGATSIYNKLSVTGGIYQHRMTYGYIYNALTSVVSSLNVGDYFSVSGFVDTDEGQFLIVAGTRYSDTSIGLVGCGLDPTIIGTKSIFEVVMGDNKYITSFELFLPPQG